MKITPTYEWEFCRRVANSDLVAESISNFLEDPTEDNEICMVRDIINEYANRKQSSFEDGLDIRLTTKEKYQQYAINYHISQAQIESLTYDNLEMMVQQTVSKMISEFYERGREWNQLKIV